MEKAVLALSKIYVEASQISDMITNQVVEQGREINDVFDMTDIKNPN